MFFAAPDIHAAGDPFIVFGDKESSGFEVSLKVSGGQAVLILEEPFNLKGLVDEIQDGVEVVFSGGADFHIESGLVNGPP